MTPDEYPDNLDDLLDRFVSGECTAAEAELVARWLDADPEPPARRERLERFRALWQASRQSAAGQAEAWDVDGAWRRAAARMTPPKVLKLTPTAPVRRRWWPAGIPASALRAAVVVLLGGIAVGVWALGIGHGRRVDAVTTAARIYTTERGERAILTLVDGTRVMLGAASRLNVPARYGVDDRVVTLEGDGYFEVLHDARRPFAVQTGRGVVRDVGTKFVVRAYAADQPLTVAVTEGEVLFANARLRQGDLGILDTTGLARIRRGADLRPYTSWIEGRLIFDDTPLAEAVATLERWYDLEISVADSALYHRHLFATLDREPPAKVLDLVALSLGARVERRGRTAVLYRLDGR